LFIKVGASGFLSTRIEGLRLAVCGVGFAVCGLGFAVCGLGFAVCGSGLAICGKHLISRKVFQFFFGTSQLPLSITKDILTDLWRI
jgi:hypothetical protein